MNIRQCNSVISNQLSSSPCGTAFKYTNDDYVGNTAHIKVVIAHDDYLTKLYVVSTTSKSFSAFMHSADIDDMYLIEPSEYSELSCDTYVICSEIEVISMDDLVGKCVDDLQFFEVKNRVSESTLNELQGKIVNSQHTIRGYKKIVNNCLGQCRLVSVDSGI